MWLKHTISKKTLQSQSKEKDDPVGRHDLNPIKRHLIPLKSRKKLFKCLNISTRLSFILWFYFFLFCIQNYLVNSSSLTFS